MQNRRENNSSSSASECFILVINSIYQSLFKSFLHQNTADINEILSVCLSLSLSLLICLFLFLILFTTGQKNADTSKPALPHSINTKALSHTNTHTQVQKQTLLKKRADWHPWFFKWKLLLYLFFLFIYLKYFILHSNGVDVATKLKPEPTISIHAS